MPNVVDPTESVDEIEEIAPEETFSDAFDGNEPEKVTEVKEPEPSEDLVVDKDVKEEKTGEDEIVDPAPEPELTALEIAEQEAKKFLEKKDDGEEVSKDSKPGEGEDEEAKPETKYEVDFSDVESDPVKYVNGLVDGISDEASRTAVKEVLSTYPELGMVMALVGKDLAGRQQIKMGEVPNLDPAGEFGEVKETITSLQQELIELKQDRADRLFFDSVEKEVPGARTIDQSDDFVAWVNSPSQSRGIHMLAASGDVGDAIKVFKAYKEFQTKSAAASVDAEAGAKKKKIDAGLTKPLAQSIKPRVDGAKDDFNEAWN